MRILSLCKLVLGVAGEAESFFREGPLLHHKPDFQRQFVIVATSLIVQDTGDLGVEKLSDG